VRQDAVDERKRQEMEDVEAVGNVPEVQIDPVSAATGIAESHSAAAARHTLGRVSRRVLRQRGAHPKKAKKRRLSDSVP
jgi:hypothetical protein